MTEEEEKNCILYKNLTNSDCIGKMMKVQESHAMTMNTMNMSNNSHTGHYVDNGTISNSCEKVQRKPTQVLNFPKYNNQSNVCLSSYLYKDL